MIPLSHQPINTARRTCTDMYLSTHENVHHWRTDVIPVEDLVVLLTPPIVMPSISATQGTWQVPTRQTSELNAYT